MVKFDTSEISYCEIPGKDPKDMIKSKWEVPFCAKDIVTHNSVNSEEFLES